LPGEDGVPHQHIGQFNQHAAARTRLPHEDVVVAVDGRDGRMTESALIEELRGHGRPASRWK
jgi:hypothetical protein